MGPNDSWNETLTGAAGVATAMGVITFALFPFALPIVLLTGVATIPFLLPAVLLVPVVALGALLWLGVRLLARGVRRLRGTRGGNAARRSEQIAASAEGTC